MDYGDFSLVLRAVSERSYTATLESPWGNPKPQSFEFPYSPADLETILAKLGDPPQNKDVAEQLGTRLFEAVFTGPIMDCLRDGLNDAGRGVRLRLRLRDAPALTALPWEFLFDSGVTHNYFAMAAKTPIVRFQDSAHHGMEQPEPLVVPLSVLVAATHSSRDDAEGNDELKVLRRAFADLAASNMPVSVDWLDHVTLETLRQKVDSGTQYHVLHFVGHGRHNEKAGGALVFEDPQLGERVVDAPDIQSIFSDHPSLRLAVLNCCKGARSSLSGSGGVAAGLVAQGVPAVVGMQFDITAPAAVAFAQELYRRLAKGAAVDEAVAYARRAIFTLPDGQCEWGSPVLYLSTTDGKLFSAEGRDPTRMSSAPRAADLATNAAGRGNAFGPSPGVDERVSSTNRVAASKAPRRPRSSVDDELLKQLLARERGLFETTRTYMRANDLVSGVQRTTNMEAWLSARQGDQVISEFDWRAARDDFGNREFEAAIDAKVFQPVDDRVRATLDNVCRLLETARAAVFDAKNAALDAGLRAQRIEEARTAVERVLSEGALKQIVDACKEKVEESLRGVDEVVNEILGPVLEKESRDGADATPTMAPALAALRLSDARATDSASTGRLAAPAGRGGERVRSTAMPDWNAMFGDELSEDEEADLLRGGADEITRFLTTDRLASERVIETLAKRTVAVSDPAAWDVLFASLKSYFGESLSWLLAGLTRPSQRERMERLAENASPEAAQLLRRISALFGLELEKIAQIYVNLRDDWVSITREVMFDQLRERYLFKLTIEKYSGELVEFEAPADSMLALATNVVRALNKAPAGIYSQETADAFREEVDALLALLPALASTPSAASAPAAVSA